MRIIILYVQCVCVCMYVNRLKTTFFPIYNIIGVTTPDTPRYVPAFRVQYLYYNVPNVLFTSFKFNIIITNLSNTSCRFKDERFSSLQENSVYNVKYVHFRSFQ